MTSTRFAAAAKPALCSAMCALAVYAITLGGTYVYDDRYIILADPRIADVARWRELWTKDYFHGGADNLYRPLVSMTYALQAKLHGTGEAQAWLFHAVNWLLHAGVSAGVAELARRVTRSAAAALFAGVLFAVHPIHVEAVANIVGRAELMCALSVVLALIVFLGPLNTRRVLLIWACFVAAVLSKEQGMLLPLLLLAATPLRTRDTPVMAADSDAPRQLSRDPLGTAYDDTPRPPEIDSVAGRRFPRWRMPQLGAADRLLVVLICWTFAGYIVVRELLLNLKFLWDRAFLDVTINPMVQSVGLDRWLMPFALLGRYAVLLVAPVRLLPDYGGGTIGSRVSFGDPYLYVGVACAIAGAIGLTLAWRRRAWTVLFCLLGFGLIYGMIGNVLTLIGTNFAERLMYLPSAFLCILAGIALARAPRAVRLGAGGVVIALFALRTVTYAAQWNEPRRLFEEGIAAEPGSVRLYLLLAEERQRQGDLDSAARTLARARDEIAPTYYRLWLNSGHLAMEQRQFADALRFARRAQQLAPTREGESLLSRAAEAWTASTRPALDEEAFFQP